MGQSHGSPILSCTLLRAAALQVLLPPHLSRLGTPLQTLLRRLYLVSLFMQLRLQSLKKKKVGCLSEFRQFFQETYISEWHVRTTCEACAVVLQVSLDFVF